MAIIKKTSITNEEKINDLLNYTEITGECLNWRGALATDGYPVMFHNKKVNRLIASLKYDQDITGLVVRHTCDNIRCINPEHLILGSHQDNMNDRDERGRTFKKITREVISKVKALLALNLFSNREIAKLVGIDSRRVADIKTGKYTDDGKLTRYIKKE